MAKLNFGGVEENVVTREEFPLSKAQEILKNETVAVMVTPSTKCRHPMGKNRISPGSSVHSRICG